MICPKCGRPVVANAVICVGCDFILDSAFLGDEILDEDRSLRPGVGGIAPGSFNLADAVILGNLDERSQVFETADSGFHDKESTGARLYVSGRSQALMAPDAVPAVVPHAASQVRLTPFETHVLGFIDGKRPVEFIRLRAGLDESEVKTALATLADKGVVQVIGRALADADAEQSALVPKSSRPRRARGPAGALAAALGVTGDDTDRAIEDAFRTQTGLQPLSQQVLAELVAADDDVPPDVFAVQIVDDSQSIGAAWGLSSMSGPAQAVLVSSDQDFERGEEDLPSDADNFEVVPSTGEFERPKASTGAGSGRAKRPLVATNARRALLDGDLRERGRSGARADGATSTQRKAMPAVPNHGSSRHDSSDGFDDFGDVSELQTAYHAAADSSLSSLASRDADVFLEVGATDSLLPPVTNSVAETAMWSPANEGGELADLVGDDPPELEGTVTSRVGPSATGFTAGSLHGARTGNPAALPPAPPRPATVVPSYDPFADVSLGPLSQQDVGSAPSDDEHAWDEPSGQRPEVAAAASGVSVSADDEDDDYDYDDDEVTAALAPSPLAVARPEAGLLHSADDLGENEEDDDEPEEPTAILSEYPRPPEPPQAASPPARTDARGERLGDPDIHELATAAPREEAVSDVSRVPTAPRQRDQVVGSSEELIDDDLVFRPGAAVAPTPPRREEATHILLNPLEAPPSAAPVGAPAPPAAQGSLPSTEMQEKARRLFEDALRDHREGRIGAARMNAKLATIYDPAEETYAAALEEWAAAGRAGPSAGGDDYAALYDGAQACEAKGDTAGALKLLEEGVARFPEIAAFHNRLGVLLAIHRREFDRAAASIQRAIELDPGNLHYKSNLGKIVSRSKQRGGQANA